MAAPFALNASSAYRWRVPVDLHILAERTLCGSFHPEAKHNIPDALVAGCDCAPQDRQGRGLHSLRA